MYVSSRYNNFYDKYRRPFSVVEIEFLPNERTIKDAQEEDQENLNVSKLLNYHSIILPSQPMTNEVD